MMNMNQNIYFNRAKYLFIDMDGTLIDTDDANNEAYKSAALIVTGKEMLNCNHRITSDSVFELYPVDVADSIILKKNEIYADFLYLTKVNNELVKLILKCGKKSFLVSNCNRERGEMTLKYHNLDSMMDRNMFYSGDKYNKSIHDLNINPKEIFVFENEIVQAHNAIMAGVNENSIYVFNN